MDDHFNTLWTPIDCSKNQTDPNTGNHGFPGAMDTVRRVRALPPQKEQPMVAVRCSARTSTDAAARAREVYCVRRQHVP
jgi:hypothetical protein